MHPNTRLKNFRLNRDVAAVLNSMRFGQRLCLEFRWFGPCWRLSDGRKVESAVARLVIRLPEVVGSGDSLFPNTTPQTWSISK